MMSEVCPKCGSADWMPADEGAFAACNDCGFTDYDEDTLALIAEVKREQAVCKRTLGYIPTFQEAFEKGFTK
jgi:predicted nucleic-acid-binding Zn-ribbon protein